jgi:hypothetical protein
MVHSRTASGSPVACSVPARVVQDAFPLLARPGASFKGTVVAIWEGIVLPDYFRNRFEPVFPTAIRPATITKVDCYGKLLVVERRDGKLITGDIVLSGS